ncbi:hypothetical protein [Spirosoma montaniterrae]|uniref:Uncharacterized protein n=1 Tax=Spirosoma montaniterrae TaxID=1178516 RepID=A0A1P9WVY0_9BACT|nr:hypothetical protein [Spirosoma montaniterrae]AQG79536.1 hypothetical protein AWR27_09505 [Spirosoma montaniterrae]
MNQTFSLLRFGRLLRTHLSENKGQSLTSLALMTGLMLAFAVLFSRGFPFAVERNRSIMFFLLGWPLWFTFIWLQTDVLNQRERAFAYLLRPASMVEKFLLIWLLTGVGFVITYLLLFTLIDAGLIDYVNNREWSAAELKQIKRWGNIRTMRPFYRTPDFWPPAHNLVLTGLLHPVCVFLFLTIKRYALPIVGVLILAILGGGYLLNSYMITQLLHLPEMLSAMPFESVFVTDQKQSTGLDLDLPQPLGNQLRYLLGITVVILLYLTAFFRLKEREV